MISIQTSYPLTVSRPMPQARVGGQFQQSTRPVQFGGVGDMVSSFIALIDKNRAAELVASDGLGMLAPRVTVAAAFRGADDARETLIREGAGLLCVAMLAGLTNQFMIWGLGNGVNLYNPHGTPAKAWINAKSMRVFSNRYNQALQNKEHQSAQAVRDAFLSKVFEDLEAGDRKLSVAGQLKNLKAIARTDSEKASAILDNLVKALPDGKAAGDFQKLFKSGSASDLKELQANLLKAGWGKLSATGKAALTEKYALGTVNGLPLIDEKAWKEVSNLSGETQRKAFLKKRIALSLEDLAKADGEFAKEIDKRALQQGLTNVVDLAGGTKNTITGQSRATFFKELKYFLQHYVDRASHEAGRHGGSGWHGAIQTKLFAANSKGLNRLWPKAEDGLVTAMLKAKTGYTLVPIGVAIAANGITTFLNNYVTRKKDGGIVRFPGEESALSGARAQNPFMKGGQA